MRTNELLTGEEKIAGEVEGADDGTAEETRGDEINAEKSLCIFLEKTEQEGIVERRGGEGKGGGGGEGVVERGGTRDRSTNDKPIVPGGENLEIHSVRSLRSKPNIGTDQVPISSTLLCARFYRAARTIVNRNDRRGLTTLRNLESVTAD
ncbi:hypothetical protein V1477_001253 [Vespula maculifrons]|uniref:Uncharacterized protein n=1 Tax=Vespula maculifrons TaxID=7453 RepID=A0ABD2CZ98_VESMC